MQSQLDKYVYRTESCEQKLNMFQNVIETGCRAVARALIGGVCSYIRVMPDGFFLKSVVFKLTDWMDFFPKRTVKLHDKDKPWIAPEYKNLIAKRQRAFIRGDHSLFCKLRNQVIREGKRLRSTFLNTKLAELKINKNNRKWWNTVKRLAGFPRKHTPLTFASDDQIISGKELAKK